MPSNYVRVCEEMFPPTGRKYKPGFLMDIRLKQQLDILIKNITKDWDFTIIISAGGEVRVGKSVLAQQIGAYWTYQMYKVHGIKVPWNVKDNIIFNWDKLIMQGNRLGEKYHYCALDYDEAGETMDSVKSQTGELKAVRDYLRECGQYNFLNILVIPEFFDLPKGIAITRSIFLIDVYYGSNKDAIFERGYFKFYSRLNKKRLYLQGKKELNYKAAPYNFDGQFPNFYTVDEKIYRESKVEALKGRENKQQSRYLNIIGCLLNELIVINKVNQKELAIKLKKEYHINVDDMDIHEWLKRIGKNAKFDGRNSDKLKRHIRFLMDCENNHNDLNPQIQNNSIVVENPPQ